MIMDFWWFCTILLLTHEDVRNGTPGNAVLMMMMMMMMNGLV
jgi:hypothetical protein